LNTAANGSSSSTPKFNGECHYCGKKGHRIADCRSRIADYRKREADHANAADDTAQARAAEPGPAPVTQDSALSSIDIVHFDDTVYVVGEDPDNTPSFLLFRIVSLISCVFRLVFGVGSTLLSVLLRASSAPFSASLSVLMGVVSVYTVDPFFLFGPSSPFGCLRTSSSDSVFACGAKPVDGKLQLLVDGGSTATIVQDPSVCTNIRRANIDICVGGGKVHCSQVGDFTFSQCIDGRVETHTTTARIVPNFGVNILSEGLFLGDECSVDKGKELMTVKKKSTNRVVLRAERKPGTWLFFATVMLSHMAQTAASCNFAGPPVFVGDASYLQICMPPDDAVSSTMIPMLLDVEQAYLARSQTYSADEWLTWHRRLGHRNFSDVAVSLGVPPPTKTPVCVSCILGQEQAPYDRCPPLSPSLSSPSSLCLGLGYCWAVSCQDFWWKLLY
jgi:hypothetical protein